MTKQQVEGLVRTGVAAGVGYLAGKGVDPALLNEISGSVVIILIAVWSWWSKKK